MWQNKLSIKYNKALKIAGVGPSPWAKLGPERWFDNYRIVSVLNRDYKDRSLVPLKGIKLKNRLSTEEIVNSRAFTNLVNSELSGYMLLPYKPIQLPKKVDSTRFIVNPLKQAKFENKRVFRLTFNEVLNIPPYKIINLSSSDSLDNTDLQPLIVNFGGRVVVQSELGSGGMGTHFAKNSTEIKRAVKKTLKSYPGKNVIISKALDGYERSVQVFVSKKRIVFGPIQQQLVRNDLLLNPTNKESMAFCGAKLMNNQLPSKEEKGIYDQALKAAKKLQSLEYRGIFGIDLLVSGNNVFSLEINARTTGALPLINEAETDLPIYLLHILELAKSRYEINEEEPILYPDFRPGPGSFIVLSNISNSETSFGSKLHSGNYKYIDGQLVPIDRKYRWNNKADIMIQLFATSQERASPNTKLCNVFMKNSSFNNAGELDDHSVRVVNLLRSKEVKY